MTNAERFERAVRIMNIRVDFRGLSATELRCIATAIDEEFCELENIDMETGDKCILFSFNDGSTKGMFVSA